MRIEPRRLRAGEALAGLAGVGMVVFLFLPWYGVGALPSYGVAGRAVSGWQALSVIDIVLAIIAALAIALAVVTATQRSPALPVVLATLTWPLGMVATILVVVRLIARPGPNAMVSDRYGAYLALVAALGIAYGAFLAMREEAPTWGEAARRRRRPAAPTGGDHASAGGRPRR